MSAHYGQMRARTRLIGQSTTAIALSVLNACMQRPPDSNDPSLLKEVASQPVSCANVADSCARRYIVRASACSQLANTGNRSVDDESRKCAAENYEAAVAHTPASSTNETRKKALVGLSDSLKALRDNALSQSESDQAQHALDQVLRTLAAQQGGQPYVQYFLADRMVLEAKNMGLPATDACQRLVDARETLPAASSDNQLKARVVRLRNAIDIYVQKRSCQ